MPHVPKEMRWLSLGRGRFYADGAAIPERSGVLDTELCKVLFGFIANADGSDHGPIAIVHVVALVEFQDEASL